jgi:hypothetical protein
VVLKVKRRGTERLEVLGKGRDLGFVSLGGCFCVRVVFEVKGFGARGAGSVIKS